MWAKSREIRHRIGCYILAQPPEIVRRPHLLAVVKQAGELAR